MSTIYQFNYYEDAMGDCDATYYFTLPNGLSFESFQEKFEKLAKDFRSKEKELLAEKNEFNNLAHEECRRLGISFLDMRKSESPEASKFLAALGSSVAAEKKLASLYKNMSVDKLINQAGGYEMTVDSTEVHLIY